jgi:hypothetical protein
MAWLGVVGIVANAGSTNPTLAFTPASLSLVSPVFYGISPTQTITATLTADRPDGESIASIKAPSAFTISNGCLSTLKNKGDSCQIQVAYTATDIKPVDASLIFTTATATEATVTYPVHAEMAPVSFYPRSPVDFYGSIGVGTTYNNLIEITDNLSTPAVIDRIVTTDDFVVTKQCGTTVPTGGQTCDLTVSFTPKTPGDHLGTLEVYVNGATTPVVAKLIGHATGVSAGLAADSSGYIWGNYLGQDLNPVNSYTFTNNGTASLQINSVTVTGDYALDPSSRCSYVAAKSTCTLRVHFIPQSKGMHHGVLSVAINGGSTLKADLNGVYYSGGDLHAEFDPDTNYLNLGTVSIDGGAYDHGQLQLNPDGSLQLLHLESRYLPLPVATPVFTSKDGMLVIPQLYIGQQYFTGVKVQIGQKWSLLAVTPQTTLPNFTGNWTLNGTGSGLNGSYHLTQSGTSLTLSSGSLTFKGSLSVATTGTLVYDGNDGHANMAIDMDGPNSGTLTMQQCTAYSGHTCIYNYGDHWKLTRN